MKVANHARVWSKKNAILLEKNGMAMDMDPGKPSDSNEGFYTAKVKSILRTHKNKIESKIGANAQTVRFTDRESDTHEVTPRKGRVARNSIYGFGVDGKRPAPLECVGGS